MKLNATCRAHGAVRSSARAGRQVSHWYPGHIAKATKHLQQQLKLVDALVEVRDARAPNATAHPELHNMAGSNRTVIASLNKSDLVTKKAASDWARAIEENEGIRCIITNGKSGKKTDSIVDALLASDAWALANAKREKKGLRPRAVRTAVVGFPNTGKSALVNRLIGRRANDSAPRPGVTRQLRWAKSARNSKLEVLDSPGILPPRLDDPSTALKLAACNDIGEAAYESSNVASELAEIVPFSALRNRYGSSIAQGNFSGEDVVNSLASIRFGGDIEQAGARILGDFQRGRLGRICLDSIESSQHRKRSNGKGDNHHGAKNEAPLSFYDDAFEGFEKEEEEEEEEEFVG